MSSEVNRDIDFQQFLGDSQEPFDFNEYCNAGDYIDPALEAQTLYHPGADAGNQLFDPDSVLDPNQASLHEGLSTVLPREESSTLGDNQEPFGFNEYCNADDYMIDSALEAQALDHPAADAGNELVDPDASVGVLEPNHIQASLHEGPSAMVPESNQLESA